MKTFKEIAVGVIYTLIGGTILTGVFQPDVFSNGISNINWILYLKILFGIGIINGWMFIMIKIKTNEIVREMTNMFNDRSRDHFYTTDEDERLNAIQSYGYINEKIACYVFPEEIGKKIEGAVPFYRLYCRR